MLIIVKFTSIVIVKNIGGEKVVWVEAYLIFNRDIEDLPNYLKEKVLNPPEIINHEGNEVYVVGEYNEDTIEWFKSLLELSNKTEYLEDYNYLFMY